MGKRTKNSSGPKPARTKPARTKRARKLDGLKPSSLTKPKTAIGDPREGAGDTGKNDGVEGSVTNPTQTAQQQAELLVNKGAGEGVSHGEPSVGKSKK